MEIDTQAPIKAKLEQRRLDNTFHSDELKRAMHKFGNLSLHVSGEGKLDFRALNKGWNPMIKVIYSGDIGCMMPYAGYSEAAIDQAIDALFDLDTCPHMNLVGNEKYVPTPEEWKGWIEKIKEDFNDHITEHLWKKRYRFSLEKEVEGKKVIVAVVTIEPLANEFVVGEIAAAKHMEFVGELDDFDQPKINSVIATVEGDDIEIDVNDLLHFRSKQRFMPKKGDYLLRDTERKLYVIIPGEDYSIH